MKPIKAYTNLEELRPVIMPHTLDDKLTQAYDDTTGADWNRAAVLLTHNEIDMILQALKVCPKNVKDRTRLTGKYYVNNWEFNNLRITEKEKEELIKREVVMELATKLYEFINVEDFDKNDNSFITEYKLDLNIEINK
jgi:predicted nucleotide-binding protein (sugar kinase/HSP70/actin superfamily)